MQALRNDAQLVFRETEKKEQRFKEQQIFCLFSDQYFLDCFLCKHPTIWFQNKNGIFQHKNYIIN